MTKIQRLKRLLKILARDTRGAAAVEYVLIASGVAASVVVAWTLLGDNLNTLFTNTAAQVSTITTEIANADSGESDNNSDSDSDADSDSDNNS